MVHFSGFARKMNHIPLLARAKRAREALSKFYVWFQQIGDFIKIVLLRLSICENLCNLWLRLSCYKITRFSRSPLSRAQIWAYSSYTSIWGICPHEGL
ncbi:MAG: hypothetical protein U5L45_12380 [Saprospiraceae bacterium]|nr:hypothetical protein [Saprospiraceae bacterium]